MTDASSSQLVDGHGRAIRTLRISVTDRCNLRCSYCRDEKDFSFIAHEDILRYEEILRVARLARDFGIRRFRITGGEPLARAGVEALVRVVHELDGVEDLSLTTNGTLLADKAKALADAGLARATLSIDSLRHDRYRRITGGGDLGAALAGLAAAREHGLEPVKVNVVVMRGVNDDEIAAFAGFAAEEDVEVRFIEHMPSRQTEEAHQGLFVSAAEIRERLQAVADWRPAFSRPGAPARRWRRADGAATVGFITPISEPFCAYCERLRLTADGRLKMCLWSKDDIDLRGLLRNSGSPEALEDAFRTAASQKPARCAELHAFAMNQVGG